MAVPDTFWALRGGYGASQLRNGDCCDLRSEGRFCGTTHLHETNGGLTIGGPMILPKLLDGRNKLFFFYSMVRDNFVIVAPTSVTVPTRQELAGNSSDLPGCPAARGAYTIYDSLTVKANPAKPRLYIRTAFPGNVIPTSRLVNPEIPFVNKELPPPNNGGAVGLNEFGNYQYNQINPQVATTYTERIDSTDHQSISREHNNQRAILTGSVLPSETCTKQAMGGRIMCNDVPAYQEMAGLDRAAIGQVHGSHREL